MRSYIFALLIIIIGVSYLRVTVFLDLFLCCQESGEGRPYSRGILPSLFFISTYRRNGLNRYDRSLPLSMYIVREGKAKLSPAALNCESISKLTSVWVPKMSADLRMK